MHPVRYDAVILGLGYVGLPLAQQAIRSGLSVLGFDVNAAVVEALGAGRSHVDDLSEADVAEMLTGGFRTTVDETLIATADVAVICVPTPLSDGDGPDLRAVTGATEAIGRNLRPGMLVVLESTTYPGTTDDVVRPLLERLSGLVAGRDFHLAFSPERIDPGNEQFGPRNTPKVVGGYTAGCTERVAQFYGRFIDTVVRTRGTREAETAKLLENTYRHVNIALVSKLGYPFRFVELAQEINATMPAYVARRAQNLLNADGQAVHGARVLLLGVTYKANIADQRESPATPLARQLAALGAKLSYHDPHVLRWSVGDVEVPRTDDLEGAAAAADLVILVQHHREYDADHLAGIAKRFFDTRGVTHGAEAHRL
jgi:UDP-N-acetyl-D-glucosamine dehydrogenase